jgi:tetratricopeptide (TPR) repeat protein
MDAAQVHQLRREPERVLEHARVATSLATERGYAYQAAVATILLGWALSALGQREDGLQQLRQGLDAFRATGAGADAPYLLALAADATGGAEGLAVAREALRAVDPDRPYFFDAELLRLHGELVLAVRGERDRASDDFRRALVVARGHRARSLELRAAMSLAELLGDADVLREAMEHGVDDVAHGDLRRARALMAELGARAT